METVKKIFNAVPPVIWIIVFIFLGVLIYWMSDDIGNWWEGRKQAEFDKAIAEKQVVIDDLTKQRDLAKIKAEEAEAREQAKAIEADLLRQEVQKYGINVVDAQKKIESATQDYANDIEFINKVKTGEITKFQLCEKQCQTSAELGYPCRATYCNKFKE